MVRENKKIGTSRAEELIKIYFAAANRETIFLPFLPQYVRNLGAFSLRN